MMNTLTNVASIKVSPGIGIGRVGNSDEYFIGPETPGVVPSPTTTGPNGTTTYKDSTGAIKPQAQRFRVYGYDSDGNCLGEITNGTSVNGDTVTIDWQTHVTNMKAANYAFQGKYAFNPNDLRNSSIQPGLPIAQRDKLIIDPGQINITGVSQGPVALLDSTGNGSKIFDISSTSELSYRLKFDPPQSTTCNVAVTYTSATVSLGNLYTDADGRLIFVGGKGISESCTTPKVVISKVVVAQSEEPNPEYNGNSYFNNPGWYDDTCGGSINASILKIDGTSLLSTNDNASQRGWMAVAPPHYVPASNNVVSLLDLQLDIFPEADPNTGKGPFYFAQAANNKVVLASSTTGDAISLNFTTLSSSFNTTTAPAIEVYRGETYIAATDTNGASHIAVSAAGNYSFTAVSSAPTTSAGPALAVLNDKLYYAINSGGQLQIGVADSQDSFTFTALTNSTAVDPDQAPSLTAFNGSLYYSVASSSGEFLLASSQNDATASNFTFVSITTPTTIQSPSTISLAVFKGKLVCGYIDAANTLYFGSSSNGSDFDFTVVNSSLIPLGPSLSAFNNNLYYAIPGNSTTDSKLAVSTDGVSFAFSGVTPGGTSSPAIATNISVNFYRDIYPILRTVTDYAWTNERAFHGHRPGTSGDFLNADYLYTLSQPEYSSQMIARSFVFNFIRPPVQDVYVQGSNTPVKVPPPPAAAPANITAGSQEQRADLMPRLFGNGGSVAENQTNGTNYPNQWLPLTDHQLEKFQQWVNGNFETGLTTDTQWQGLSDPDQLSFAALQPTVGGGFHPGIELTYLMHESMFFNSPFRFVQDTVPGSIAGYMSVPWQGDFWSCNISWWPALRPDIVVERTTDATPVLSHISWFRGNEIPPESDSISGYEGGYNVMVDSWKDLGFVTPVAGEFDQGQQVFEETERATSLNTPSVLVSINSSQISNGTALTDNSGALITQTTDGSMATQQWQLTESKSSAGYFFIQDPTSADVLTVDFSTSDVSLTTQAVPQQDSQLWQYTPSGYPGHFKITSKINLQLLSVQSDNSVNTAAALTSLQQLWLLEASSSS